MAGHMALPVCGFLRDAGGMEKEMRKLRPNRRRRPGETAAERLHERPVGVQGPNFGYWQADGASRSAAKRTKRP